MTHHLSKRIMRRLRSRQGFTLVEALIAVAVMMTGVLILEKNFIASVMGNNSAKLTTASVAAASGLLEEIQSLSYDTHCGGDELLKGCVDLEDRDGGGNAEDMAATVDSAGNVSADLACTWNADGQRVTTARGYPLPNNLNNSNITVFLNICEDCPPAAGGDPITNTKLIRVISRYRDPSRPNSVANDDPLFLKTQQNQEVMVEYVKTRAE